MKRFVCLIASAAFALTMFLPIAISVKAAPEVLRVYNWEDYIGLDENGKELWSTAFSNFYAERNPGKTVKVEYSTFGTNEDLFNQMQINKKGYDLVCPSDYMIEKMIENDMLEKFDLSKIQTYNDNVSPYISDLFENNGVEKNGEIRKWADYAAGYMWGTLGFVYNPEIVAASDVDNWSAIWNIEYKNKSTLKDSYRDTYFLALGYVFRDDLNLAADKFAIDKLEYKAGLIDETEFNSKLEAYQNTLRTIFNNTEEATIAKVKSALLLASKNIFSFELDEGKNDMATGKIALNFAWSGDAVAAMDNAQADGTLLNYAVPRQGSNVWFDGWVMPKGAKKDLAYEFINFLSQPNIAMLNMDEIGYTSVISGGGVLERIQENYEDADGEFEYDISYFFVPSDQPDKIIIKTDVINRQLLAQYPSIEVIERCTIMQNFKDQEILAISRMWDSVKSNPLPAWAIILIVVGGLGIAGGTAALIMYRKKAFKKSRKKMTVVKKG